MKKNIGTQVAPEGYVFVKEGSLDEMADNIKTISQAVKRFSGEGRLNHSAILLLVREGTRRFGNVVDERDVENVLKSLANLEDRFVTPKKKKTAP